jgi:hypothetical protein
MGCGEPEMKERMSNLSGKMRERTALDELTICAQSCISQAEFVHAPIARLFDALEWKRSDFERFVQNAHNRVAQSLAGDKQFINYKSIPKLYHKIWVTDVDNPSLPPDEFLGSLLHFCSQIGPEWTLVVWSNSDVVLTHIRSLLSSAKNSMLFVLTDDAFRHDPLYQTAKRLIDARKFVVAGDVLKVAVIDRFGGIYSDIGLQLSSAVLDLCTYSDYVFLLGHAVFLQTSLLAAAPNSRITAFIKRVIQQPEAYRKSQIADTDRISGTDEVRAFSGVGTTISVILQLAPYERAIFLPTRSIFHEWQANGSWYNGNGNFGNILISQSQPTVLSNEGYLDFDTLEASQIVLMNVDPKTRESVVLAVKAFALSYKEDETPSSLRDIDLEGFVDFLIRWLPPRSSVLNVCRHLSDEHRIDRVGRLEHYFPDGDVVSVKMSGSVIMEVIRSPDNCLLNSAIRQHDSYDVFEPNLILDDGSRGSIAILRDLPIMLQKLRASGVYVIRMLNISEAESWISHLREREMKAVCIKDRSFAVAVVWRQG